MRIPTIAFLLLVSLTALSPGGAADAPPCDVPDAPEETCSTPPSPIDCLASGASWKECLTPRP